MTERLCDIRARRLALRCDPCRRRGSYDLDRLRRRFGEHGACNLYSRKRPQAQIRAAFGIGRDGTGSPAPLLARGGSDCPRAGGCAP